MLRVKGIISLHNFEDIMQNMGASLTFIYGNMKSSKGFRA
jgi:hypothetical protein